MTTMSQQPKAPQPAIIAPSREDILSNLAFFFGDPASPEKLRDYSEHQAATYHFPDAFYGQNNRIRDTLNNLILKSPQEWQTNVGLPFVKIEGTTVEWDELHFDVRLLQRVPYEGVSRMQTSLRRRHRDRVVRRGIGMMIESDFYSTQAGRDHFRDQLQSIRYCVQETCNFDTLYSYLTCQNYDFRYDIQKGLRPKRSIRAAMAHDVSQFAVVQKEGLGLDKAIETAKARMARYQVTPNMMIVPPELLLYIATSSEEKHVYNIAGPAGPERFEGGVAGYEARAFRGCGVFTSVPFEISEEADSLQMLQRNTQVGEFYRMRTPPIRWTTDNAKHTNYMDIVIYDEERDMHVHISFREALKAAAAMYNNGARTINAMWGNAAGITDADEAAEATAGATDETIEDKIINYYANASESGTWVEMSLVVARPFIEHRMMSAVLAVAGRDTGATLFGPADMQISANTSVKTIEGHYTCHTKSVITKPQNVMVMRDIMCNGYVAGGNCDFFGMQRDSNNKPTMDANGNHNYDKTKIQQDINSRLTMAEGEDYTYPSMLALAEEYNSPATRDQVISVSNRVLPWDSTAGTNFEHFPGGKKGWSSAGQVGLDTIHYGEDLRATTNQDFIAASTVNNSVCFLGPHRVYSQWSATYQELVPGQGHFGPDALPGDARWRRGESVSRESARNAMTGIEAAAHSQLVFQNRR